MAYKVVKLSELMSHEFVMVEADFDEVNERLIAANIPQGMNYQILVEKIKQGEFVLLTEMPTKPAMQFDKFAKSWHLSPLAKESLPISASNALLARSNLSGAVAGNSGTEIRATTSTNIDDTYVPEPLKRDTSQERLKPQFEYNFEIACSDASFRENVSCHFELAKTKQEGVIGNWQIQRTEKGTRYTVYSAIDEPKRLVAKVASNVMGISIQDKVKVIPIGSGVVNEAFLAVTPSVQLGERLGLPTEGYFYHFYNGKLIQEYKLRGDKKSSFYGTCSTSNHLDDSQACNIYQTALLVYWKVGGKVVENQYLVYLEQQITRDILDNVNDEWLSEHGVKLDIFALLKTTQQPVIVRENKKAQDTTQEKNVVHHIVNIDPETGQRETWAKIAEQHGLAPKDLLVLNPSYDANPMLLAVGDCLNVKKTDQSNLAKASIYGVPPLPPREFNHLLNTYYDYSERFLLNTTVKAINARHFLESDIPLVNVKSERTLHIGIFFDGTGQNSANDEYKETYGNKSRTNIARLFDAYPEQEGQSAKIYISGVGTVDGILIKPGEPNSIIDAGDDEKLAGQAMGAFDDTGGLWKWQSLLKRLQQIVSELNDTGIYQTVNHIQFDVFGFSRGAALARHFVNAVSEGFPDYINPLRSPNPSSLVPNLLGNENYKRFDSLSNEFYTIDTVRRVSVHFVGLFDTVGSFYLPGNENEGNYQLGIKSNAAERVFQICAKHEYRKNFPLTSLGKGHQEAIAFVDGIFCQEVFPGSHTDIGGGYPSKLQYGRTDLPSRLNTPIDATYNRHLIKTVSLFNKYQAELRGLREANAAAVFAQQKLDIENQTWQRETLEKEGIYGEVKLVDGHFLYYHFVPISNAISQLAFERMKQQAGYHGIDWSKTVLDKQKSITSFDGNQDMFIHNLRKRIENMPLGTIQDQMKMDEEILLKSYIHRPHDALINPGYETISDAVINELSLDISRQTKRQVYSND